MAVIKIEVMGGEMPSLSPRTLPVQAAQTNNNLFLGVNEFRPLKEDLIVGTATAGAKSLYRLTSTSPWLTAAVEEYSWVRGQINDDTTGRTYFSCDSEPLEPRVTDLAGTNRKLGVPRPASKPAVTVNVTDELSTDELGEAANQSATLIQQAIDETITTFFTGNGITFRNPTPSAYGWIGHETDQTNSYIAAPLTNGVIQKGLEFLQSPQLGGRQSTWDGSPYWLVEVNTGAVAYSVSQSSLSAALQAIDDPYVPGQKLVDAASAAYIAGETAEYFSQANAEIAPLQSAALAKTALIEKVLAAAASGTAQASLATSSVYLKPLEQLMGSGTSGSAGSVTSAIMDRVYIMVSNSFWGQLDNTGSWITDYTTQGTPLLWWRPSTQADPFHSTEGQARIRSAISAAISALPDGYPGLDYDGLRAVVMSEFNHLVSRRPTAESQNYYAGLVGSWADEALAPLRTFFSHDNMVALALGLTGGTDAATAFGQALREADAALNALGSQYALRRSLTHQIALNAYGSGKVNTSTQHTKAAVTRFVDSRFYLYTYVTDWGEESEPSAVSDMVQLDQNDSTTVTMTAPPAWVIPVDNRHVVKWRLYRTNTGSQASEFQFVDEGPINTLTYTDTKTGAELGEVCPSSTWLEPPSNLKGLVGMPNGIMAGFFGNTVAFCEPYHPYAWPFEYQIVLEHDVVGLGVFGQTLFVGTVGNPYFITGTDSASMSAQKLEIAQSCASRRSVVPIQGGVLFASPDGLCLADSSGISVVSSGMFTREDWQALTPTSMFGAHHENIYYCFYAGGTKCLTFDLASRKLGRVDLAATAAYNDTLTDTLYVISGTKILALFGAATWRTGKWKSKLMTMPQQVGMAWLKVYGSQSANVPVTVRVYADGALVHTATVKDLTPQRLPPGRWLEFEVEIESKARVTSVVLASSTQELQAL